MTFFTENTDKNGKIVSISTDLFGKDLLVNPKLNKGTAFTQEERELFGLLGKLPESVESLNEQVERCYQQFLQQPNALAKNAYLNELKQSNETLFYHLAQQHLSEMLPIVYTPTIGDAVEKFSFEFNLPQGLYLAYPEIDKIDFILKNRFIDEIDLIIVTDGEGVLGIGDWGIGGMDICVGKLMVYTLCGGINPRRVLPIQLDVGTNNESLLNDPMYLGWRNKRISGKEYDKFIDAVVTGIQKNFPNIYLHWEDFGRDNARKNLNRYREKMCTFNDDMQGTGATALACVLAAVYATEQDLKDQRIVFFGAGTAGVGIADQICAAMVNAGLSKEQAQQQFYLIDRPGLLLDDMPDVADFQKPYAHSRAEIADWDVQDPKNIGLADVVSNAKPTILIGCSTCHGAFNKEIVQSMASNVKHPIIFPLSNPTSKSEATAADLIDWTNGKAIVATGSPFDPVSYNGSNIRISQCNNAFVFPGLGLGIIAVKATRVSDGMIHAASETLAQCSPALADKTAPVLPDIDDAPTVSKKIALAVAKKAREEGFTNLPDDVDLEDKINAIFWQPEYLPYKKEE